MDIPAWSGVLPLALERTAPVAQAQRGVPEPAHVKAWRA
jgi:hypothetical protein